MKTPPPKRKSPQRLIHASPAAADTLMRLAKRCDFGTRVALIDVLTKKMAAKHDEPFQVTPKSSGRSRA